VNDLSGQKVNETPPVDITGIEKSIESIFGDIVSPIRTQSLKETFVHEYQREKLLKYGDGWNAFGFVSSGFLQKSANFEREEKSIDDGR
jgi:hypothetical protein